jgi:hypothetical protein
VIRKLVTAALCASVLVAVAAPAADAAQFVYERQGSPINGRIRGECGYQCVSSWYRAGSGNGGTKACEYHNWLPLGTYDVWFHDDSYGGSLIRGRVWRLQNFFCAHNGVTRTELFVHTEETQDRGQACTSHPDDPFCWEGANDYYSLGCIKVARMPIGSDGKSDIGRLDTWAHAVVQP